MINDLVRTAVPYITFELPFLSLTRYCSFPCMPLLEYRENSSVRFRLLEFIVLVHFIHGSGTLVALKSL